MARPPLRRWLARWWHTTGFLAPPTIVTLVLLAAGFGIGIRANQDAINRSCRHAAVSRSVERELLEIRINVTPQDPAVPEYRRMLERLPPIHCPD